MDYFYTITQSPPPKGAEKRPLRAVVAATERERPGDNDPACAGFIFGLTLACGHYVERYSLPQHRARCDDCFRRAPIRPPLVIACPVCGGADGCGRCLGFGAVEALMCDKPRPGMPGDYVCGLWTSCLGAHDVVTVVAKRGAQWLGEHRVVPHPGGATEGQFRRFRLPPGLSERNHIHAHEVHAANLQHVRRSFIELRTTDNERFRRWLTFAVEFLHADYSANV